ncbi:MAG: hypothetical protein LH629_06015 [Ignavibacteria bacterium]|nr:hypothetical protein [Ignavibacteria bacterium]
MKKVYCAEEENWDLIFDRLGEDIESKVDDMEIKYELKKAYRDIKEIENPQDVFKVHIQRVIDAYYQDALDNLNDYDEDDHPDHHVFYSLEKLSSIL